VSRMVLTDMVLLLCIQGSIASFCLARLAGEGRSSLYLAMYTCWGFGLLAKGPIAVALPAAILIPWLWRRGELAATVRASRPALGLAVVGLIAAPWYGLAHWLSGGEFTRRFFLMENWARLATVVNQHDQPSWFFVALLP